jgi:hypothetical protein
MMIFCVLLFLFSWPCSQCRVPAVTGVYFEGSSYLDCMHTEETWDIYSLQCVSLFIHYRN